MTRKGHSTYKDSKFRLLQKRFFGGFPQLFTFVSKSPAVVWAFVYMCSLGFLRRVAQLSATFVLSSVLRLSPTFVSECLRFFVSQSLKFSGASDACLKCSSEGFPAVVYVCLPIVLGRFRELLLHWSLSFCSSLVPLVPLVLVLEFAFLRNGILTKKAINPCTPALHKKINHVV